MNNISCILIPPFYLNMSKRNKEKQSEHDQVIHFLEWELFKKGYKVWVNPGQCKYHESWGLYIDVIAQSYISNLPRYSVFMEVETDDTVDENETREWINYEKAYYFWYLVIPENSKNRALTLLRDHHIENCRLITWKKDTWGRISVSELP